METKNPQMEYLELLTQGVRMNTLCITNPNALAYNNMSKTNLIQQKC